MLTGDTLAVDAPELERWLAILPACWRTLDAAIEAAAGVTLQAGPRGGGRDLAQIIRHVTEADVSYLRSLGGALKTGNDEEPGRVFAQVREASLTTLRAAVRGEVPAQGPRGGLRWPPRFFVRRMAWHDLDHAWEIEDRIGYPTAIKSDRPAQVWGGRSAR